MKEYNKSPEQLEKVRLRNKEYKKTNNYKNGHLKYYFGITLEEYQKMLISQKGVCAICGLPETSVSNSGKIKMLSVDHCHRTNRVRGLLCNNCNRGIGMLQENIETLQAAIKYISER